MLQILHKNVSKIALLLKLRSLVCHTDDLVKNMAFELEKYIINKEQLHFRKTVKIKPIYITKKLHANTSAKDDT
jgi:hypothetical protein